MTENSITIFSDPLGNKKEEKFFTVEHTIERVVVIVNGRTYDMTPESFFSMVEEYWEE